jgi:hypothetical protein
LLDSSTVNLANNNLFFLLTRQRHVVRVGEQPVTFSSPSGRRNLEFQGPPLASSHLEVVNLGALGRHALL